jgi:hypothetical protein
LACNIRFKYWLLEKGGKEMFKMKFTALMAIVMMLAFSLFCAGNSYAVEVESMQGKQFVSVFGNINSSDEVTTMVIGGTFGKFFTDNMEGNGTLMLIGYDTDFDDATMYILSGKFNYNFFQSGLTYIPYAGCALGLAGYDAGGTSDSSLSIGVQGGIKYFISEDTSFNLEASLTHYEIEGESIDSFAITAGISYYFGD